jgi:hypothetical protein
MGLRRTFRCGPRCAAPCMAARPASPPLQRARQRCPASRRHRGRPPLPAALQVGEPGASVWRRPGRARPAPHPLRALLLCRAVRRHHPVCGGAAVAGAQAGQPARDAARPCVPDLAKPSPCVARKRSSEVPLHAPLAVPLRTRPRPPHPTPHHLLHNPLPCTTHVRVCRHGDKVSLFSENGSRWLIADQAIMKCGAADAVRPRWAHAPCGRAHAAAWSRVWQPSAAACRLPTSSAPGWAARSVRSSDLWRPVATSPLPPTTLAPCSPPAPPLPPSPAAGARYGQQPGGAAVHPAAQRERGRRGAGRRDARQAAARAGRLADGGAGRGTPAVRVLACVFYDWVCLRTHVCVCVVIGYTCGASERVCMASTRP